MNRYQETATGKLATADPCEDGLNWRVWYDDSKVSWPCWFSNARFAQFFQPIEKTGKR